MASITHGGHDHAGHGDHDHYEVVHHQFEDLDQQNESYMVGMWTFLVTEVMFFGALFLTYTLYRANYQVDWFKAHEHLSVFWGGLNTVNLLFSSMTMALGVHYAQLKDRKGVLRCLGITLLCAAGFMVIKYIEYSGKFADRLFPDANFTDNPAVLHGANLNHAQLFFGLYFAMTGLHGVHVVVGILIISTLAWLWYKKKPYVTEDYIPTELIGLYWHFVDIVWIFLFPLFYLMPMPNALQGLPKGGGH